MYLKQDEFRETMLNEAMLIIESVGFIEKQIYVVLGELQDAENNHCYENVKKIEAQIRFLLKKVNDENKHMDEFQAKYKEKINEKKTILSNIEQKKQIYDGGIPTNKNRTPRRSSISGRFKKEEQRLAVNH